MWIPILVQIVKLASRSCNTSKSHWSWRMERLTNAARTGNVIGCRELASRECRSMASIMDVTCSQVYWAVPHKPDGHVVVHPMLSVLDEKAPPTSARNDKASTARAVELAGPGEIISATGKEKLQKNERKKYSQQESNSFKILTVPSCAWSKNGRKTFLSTRIR